MLLSWLETRLGAFPTMFLATDESADMNSIGNLRLLSRNHHYSGD
jgi:hypothetical protein